MNRTRLLEHAVALRDRLRGFAKALLAIRKTSATERAEAERLDRIRNPSKYLGK